MRVCLPGASTRSKVSADTPVPPAPAAALPPARRHAQVGLGLVGDKCASTVIDCPAVIESCSDVAGLLLS